MKNVILIVDDCEIYQGALQMLMEKEGYRTEICSDGMQAMIRTNQNMDTIAAVLLDIYMPEIDGISLLGHLRHRYPDLPVFIVSGSEESQDQSTALNLGAKAFIPKPLSAESIAKLLQTLRDGREN